MKITDLASTLALACLLAAPAAAANKREAPPEALKRLLDCRAVTDRDARLACFDTQVAAIDTAVDKQELVIADRAQINKARRSLFGLTLPSFAIFGSGNDGDDEEKAAFSEIETVVKQARLGPDGNWRFTVEDGARWAQIDSRGIPVSPRPGMPVKIRKAAMGSFLANFNKQIAVRVRREN